MLRSRHIQRDLSRKEVNVKKSFLSVVNGQTQRLNDVGVTMLPEFDGISDADSGALKTFLEDARPGHLLVVNNITVLRLTNQAQ